jgi:neopullulanase
VVKDANPEAYIVGEIWHEAHDWLQGDQFDAVMNYPFLWPTLSFFGRDTLREYHKTHLTFEPLDAPEFGDSIQDVFEMYDWEITQAQLNLLDSHDMGRALWVVGENTGALRLSVLFQMTVPGAPCVYYGDEIGMSAGDDPHCREAFPWDNREAWDDDLLDHYQRAAALRHDHEVLRTGQIDVFYAEDTVVGFRRVLNDAVAICLFNAGTSDAVVDLSADDIGVPLEHYTSAWPADGPPLDLDDGAVTTTLDPQSARVWVRRE